MKAKRNDEKTVYVLGAGFSAPAGGPSQGSLLRLIFALPGRDPKVRRCKAALKKFLIEVLNAGPRGVADVSLEDIYTPIDRCLADGVSLRGRNSNELRTIRGQLDFLISLAIDRAFATKAAKDRRYVQDFAEYLVDRARHRSELAIATDGQTARQYDPFAIISLNWDIALDRQLHRELANRDGGRQGLYEPIGVVDYCCYVSSIEKNDDRIRPGLWALGARGYNVKLLKIHGSMNWLQCSNCQRLFVAFDEKVNIPNYFESDQCRHCDKHGVGATLQSALVMPTFLKDLSNFQIKLVWQNAGVELMEARHIVFIGYSLPYADFEFRQLMSRMLNKSASVHVVLFRGKADQRRQYLEECRRYRQFFNGRRITFDPGGVLSFVGGLKERTKASARGVKQAGVVQPTERADPSLRS